MFILLSLGYVTLLSITLQSRKDTQQTCDSSLWCHTAHVYYTIPHHTPHIKHCYLILSDMLMSIPRVTILSDTSNHFNSKNYTLWKLTIFKLLKEKSLSSYIDGSITCLPIPVTTTGVTSSDPMPMPIYSSILFCDEWKFCDQLTHLHIVLNIVDSISLGVKRDGTAKEC